MFSGALISKTTRSMWNAKILYLGLEDIVKNIGFSGFDVGECKLKIKNLRSHYCQEFLKKLGFFKINNY